MTELEYEKACRGRNSPVANEFAWGDANIASSAYAIQNSGTVNEAISSGYATGAGNCSYQLTTYSIPGPVRVGIYAANGSNSGRRTSGGSYYGIMELSGNVWELCVTCGNPAGRGFTGTHGDGVLSLNGNATKSDWPGYVSGEVTTGTGGGFRGGFGVRERGEKLQGERRRIANRNSRRTSKEQSPCDGADGFGNGILV
jgi:formylglycine-generating enzyme required for sulfatase activity